MSFSKAVTRRGRRPFLALAAMAAGCLLATPSAQTAGPMPLFQVPVPCGQTWDISTYAGHWGPDDPDALDMAQRDLAGTNISEGEPALAAAAGTVKELTTTGNGEHRVFLDHGGGWETAYIHLESLPPLTVGQHVAQGEMVGRISNSGADGMHLHYNQERDGELTRVSFNGHLVDTHQGDEDSWGTWGSDDAEEVTSVNCPGNSFVPFTQNGERYQLIYKPGYADPSGSGLAKIVRLDDDGKGVTTTWADYLGQRYTNLVPFTLGANTYLFAYQASTGKISYHRMNLHGEGLTALSSGTWWKGWTHVTPFSLGCQRVPAHVRLAARVREHRPHRSRRQRLHQDPRRHVDEGLDALHALRARRQAVRPALQGRHRPGQGDHADRQREQRVGLDRVVGRLVGRLDAPGADQAQGHRAPARLSRDDR